MQRVGFFFFSACLGLAETFRERALHVSGPRGKQLAAVLSVIPPEAL